MCPSLPAAAVIRGRVRNRTARCIVTHIHSCSCAEVTLMLGMDVSAVARLIITAGAGQETVDQGKCVQELHTSSWQEGRLQGGVRSRAETLQHRTHLHARTLAARSGCAAPAYEQHNPPNVLQCAIYTHHTCVCGFLIAVQGNKDTTGSFES